MKKMKLLQVNNF